MGAEAVLIELADLYEDWRGAHGYQIQAVAAESIVVNSVAEAEVCSVAFYRGEVAVFAAADHLRALGVTLCHQGIAFATFVLARACLEACALSRWLMNPELPVTTRIERTLELEHRDSLEGLKASSVWGIEELREVFEARIRNVADAAVKLRAKRRQDSQGKLLGFGAALNFTDLASSELGAGGQYRFHSAVVHGAAWALRKAGLVDVKTADPLFETPVVKSARAPEAMEFLI